MSVYKVFQDAQKVLTNFAQVREILHEYAAHTIPLPGSRSAYRTHKQCVSLAFCKEVYLLSYNAQATCLGGRSAYRRVSVRDLQRNDQPVRTSSTQSKRRIGNA